MNCFLWPSLKGKRDISSVLFRSECWHHSEEPCSHCSHETCPQESIFPQLLHRQLRAISSVDVYAVMWSQARIIPYSLTWSRYCSCYMTWTQKFKSKDLLLNISAEIKNWCLEIANPGMIWVREDRITSNIIFNLLLMNKLIPSFAQVHKKLKRLTQRSALKTV